MGVLRNLPYIVIVLLLGYVFFLKECTPPLEPEIVYQDSIVEVLRVDTVYIPEITTITEPEYIYKDTGSIKIILDTIFVLKDYETKYFYRDTILNDYNAFIVVSDTIYQNKIKSRQNQIKVHSRTYFTPVEKRNKVFLGLGVYSNLENLGLTANVHLLTKRDNMYSIGCDPFNKSLYLSMGWKIQFKRR